MDIKKYFTTDTKRLIALLIIAGIVFAITAIMMINSELNFFGVFLLVVSFIALPVLLSAIVCYIYELHRYYCGGKFDDEFSN